MRRDEPKHVAYTPPKIRGLRIRSKLRRQADACGATSLFQHDNPLQHSLLSPSLSFPLADISFLPLSADLVRNIFLDYFLGARIERFALCVCVPRQGADFWYQHDGIRCGLPPRLLPLIPYPSHSMRSHKTICHIYTS